ncbi:tetratricopeptide repeat protein [Methanoplanus endosymbiosus]|uniref:Tetratricopeptide repeat protein n=1 Tax=Methanoplanus endosymbiosus TaxID=33865 RepID=A0A9E7THT4_9EURY|nr:tetratricopeptide repeat protein [Methanoplanus endosymbiosus]UUX91123.1 tetratricopeptide repeat protein [Methanoplanus endosymbiosus]
MGIEQETAPAALPKIIPVLIVLVAVVIIPGCTELSDSSVVFPGGTQICIDNETHLKWMEEFRENPEKYLTNPENPFEWTIKGMHSTATPFGDEQAIEYYNKAIEIDSEFPMAYCGKAEALGNLKRFNESVECLRKAVELDSRYEPWADKLRQRYSLD